jgi:DNA-binding NarL/FixJ family response regulator
VQKPKTLIGIGAQPLRDDLVRAIVDHVELRGIATGTALLDQLDNDNDIELVITDLSVLRAIARRLRLRCRGKGRNEPAIVLALANDEFGDALGLLDYCRGFLFWQHGLDKLGSLIALAREGYCSVPPALLPDLLSDRVRVARVNRLTSVERHVFALLAEAKSNRAIAATLGVPEPVAKSLVRAVLAKLRLKNRTEAAVFATRLLEAAPGTAASDVLDAAPEPLAS